MIKELKNKTKINGKEITKTITYKIKFIDNVRFMAILWSNLVENLSEEFFKAKCKYGHND